MELREFELDWCSQDQEVTAPVDWIPLSVGFVLDGCRLWALCPLGRKEVKTRLLFCRTGEKIETDNLDYIGTAVGTGVVHVFCEAQEKDD